MDNVFTNYVSLLFIRDSDSSLVLADGLNSIADAAESMKVDPSSSLTWILTILFVTKVVEQIGLTWIKDNGVEKFGSDSAKENQAWPEILADAAWNLAVLVHKELMLKEDAQKKSLVGLSYDLVAGCAHGCPNLIPERFSSLHLSFESTRARALSLSLSHTHVRSPAFKFTFLCD